MKNDSPELRPRPAALADYRLFFREFRRNFRATGAITPSSRWLGAALAHHVRYGHGPRRILEVGPGTGAITRQILRVLGPDDQLDLVEVNAAFVEHLRGCFASHPMFVPAASRARVIQARIEELPQEPTYDVIISGLPLNNFQASEVRAILTALLRLARPGGRLSFFEYIAVRPARSLVSNAAERRRLREVGKVLREVLRQHEVRRQWVWSNLPPAWVHHVRCEQVGG